MQQPPGQNDFRHVNLLKQTFVRFFSMEKSYSYRPLLRQRHAYITALAGGRTNGKLKAAHTNQYNVV